MHLQWRFGIALGFFLLLGDFNSTFAQVNSYGQLPLSFEPNQGQTDPRVKFLSRGNHHTLFLTPGEAVLVISSGSADRGTIQRSDTGVALRMRLVHANPQAEITGSEELPGKVNYLIGNDPKRWHSNLPTYARVQYKEVYPGIDLIYHGHEGQLEYDFVVYPGADPGRIGLELRGADRVEVDGDGDLLLHTTISTIRQRRPVIYQEVNGLRREVSGRYVLKDKHHVSFQVGTYDRGRPLVIDPIIYSTYLGGIANDSGNAIAVDSAGSAYLTGFTLSPDFPTTAGAFQRTLPSAGGNAFVTKLNPAGSTQVYSTYLGGGSNQDEGFGIAVDSAGSAYVTGFTSSTDFPTTAGAFQRTLADGATNAFVTKLDPAGSMPVYSTYLGGSNQDEGFGIALDSLGAAYVTGFTASPDFPTTLLAFQTMCACSLTNGFAADAFVTKLNATGSALVYSTYLGGNNTDEGLGIAVDLAGSAYVTGETASSTDFPRTLGAFQMTFGGGDFDAFVTKLSPTGSILVYSTYLGGSSTDEGLGIAADSAGSGYVTGFTSSSNFPTTPFAFQKTFGGGASDAFVTKLNPLGTAPLVYSTFLGGSAIDQGAGIAVDLAGSAHVTGFTRSGNFPTTPDAVQPSSGGNEDAFVTKLNPTGSGLASSTFLGGSGADFGLGIVVDLADSAYVTGNTASIDFPTTTGVFQTTLKGGADAFVAKIATVAAKTATTTKVSCMPNPVPVTSSTTCTATVSNAIGVVAPRPTGSVTFTSNGAGTFSSPSCTLNASGQCSVTYKPGATGTQTITATYGGDSVHAGSSGTTTVTATLRPTSTSVSCNPSSFQLGLSTTCIATVTDGAGAGATTPAGMVAFTSNGAGTFSSPSCTLNASGQCSVTYTPGATGTQTITATYGGDSVHAGSSGSTALTVTVPGASEVEGGGKIAVPRGLAEFGFEVERETNGGAPHGGLEYRNRPRRLTVHATRIRTLNIDGNTATFSGDCKKKFDGGQWVACTFWVTAIDNGNPGRGRDKFTIQVSGEPQEGSALIRGNIEIEPAH